MEHTAHGDWNRLARRGLRSQVATPARWQDQNPPRGHYPKFGESHFGFPSVLGRVLRLFEIVGQLLLAAKMFANPIWCATARRPASTAPACSIS
jgi:uncharacterized membrane protein